MAQERVDRMSWQPVVIPQNGFDAALETIRKEHPELAVVDHYEKNLEELFLLRNPNYRFDKNYQDDFRRFTEAHCAGSPMDAAGAWFYFPWLNTLVHYLNQDFHYELRTGRNRNLITKEEQEAYFNATVAVLGMSVGSHVAVTIAMTGGAKHFKLADPDTISGDNLNRIRSGYQNVGINKAIVVARQIFEINPYAEIELYEEGLHERNVEQVLGGVTVVVEEMDNPFFKIKIREIARRRGIPVVMGTDNGDGIIVDIERFDLDKNYPILHGKIGAMTAEEFRNLPPEDLPRVAAKIAGANLAVPRMLLSIAEVGKTLYSWPQLGTAATMCGTAVAYLTRKIILKAPNIKSDRYQVNLDAIFESDYGRKWFSRKMNFLEFIRKMKNK